MWCYSQGDTKVDNKPSAVKTCKNPCEIHDSFSIFFVEIQNFTQKGM